MEIDQNVSVNTLIMKGTLEYSGTPVLKYTIEYPEFSSDEHPRAVKRMNSYYEKEALAYHCYIITTMLANAISGYKMSIAEDYPIREYEAMLTFTLTYNQDCAVSLYNQKYEYQGGAHGITLQTSQTWDLNTGTQLPLKALFPQNYGYARDLKREIIIQIEEIIAQYSYVYFENYLELVEENFNPKNFYLTPDNIAIYYQEYEIAPHSSGIPTFLIPYSAVDAKLPKCT